MRDITVVIPAYNHAQFLDQAIESVLRSSCDADIILIDDGSSDATPLVAGKYSEVRYVRQANAGAHAAINRGFEMARTSHVAILNDDDLFQPWHLPSVLRMVREQGADIVLSRPTPFGSGPLLAQARLHEEAADYVLARYGPSLGLFYLNWFVGTSGITSSVSAWEQIGGFRNFRLVHDLDFALRAISWDLLHVRASMDRSWQYRCHGFNTVSGISAEATKREVVSIIGPYGARLRDLGVLSELELRWGFALS